jgi:hypothetical protein
MTMMYNPMNTDLMFQEMDNRAQAMRAARTRGSVRETRRWWRRSTQRHAG